MMSNVDIEISISFSNVSFQMEDITTMHMCILRSVGNEGLENHYVRDYFDGFWIEMWVNERRAGNLCWNCSFSKPCYGFDDIRVCCTWMNFDGNINKYCVCVHLFPTAISPKPITHLLQSSTFWLNVCDILYSYIDNNKNVFVLLAFVSWPDFRRKTFVGTNKCLTMRILC